jgi:beta-glucosidase
MKLLLIASFIVGLPVFGADFPIYKQASAPLEARVNDLFSRLTPEEKLSLLSGTGFATRAIPRLDVPSMAMADAGQGVRGGEDSTKGPATAFPGGVLMASSWDTNLLREIGQAIGVEAHNKGSGVQILLGPGINIHRSPLGGRNGEYFSEDPYLTGELAVAYIRGVQSNGVSACVKHFACNNQETDRHDVNAIVDERALHEIYFPAFRASVQRGGVWSVMSSYNAVNGRHTSANPYLLTDTLKKRWAFSGLVVSDWGGIVETTAVQAGNDLEMPTGGHMSAPQLKAALVDGSVTQAAVDDSVRRILRTIIRVGLLDGEIHREPSLVNSPEHQKLALEAAEQGIVLLKNQHKLLPLDSRRIRSIAVIGEAAQHLQIDALGSGEVPPGHLVELLDGIKAQAGDAHVYYEAGELNSHPVPSTVITSPEDYTVHGFRAEYFKNRNLEGQPALVRVDDTISLKNPQPPATGFPQSEFSVRWTGKLTAPTSGNYLFTFTGDDGFRIFLGDKLLINNWIEESATPVSALIKLQAGKSYDLRVEYFQAGGDYSAHLNWNPPGKAPFPDAVAVAKKSDVVVVCVSTKHTEVKASTGPPRICRTVNLR